MENNNEEFYVNNISSSVEQMQIALSNKVASRALLGFAGNDSSTCKLSVISMLIHAFDNWILYSEDVKKSLLNLYNTVINE